MANEIPESYCTGLTQGEAKVLIGQLAGDRPAEIVGGWTLIYEDDERGLGVLSSALMHDNGPPRIHEVLFMLVDAAREIAKGLREGG